MNSKPVIRIHPAIGVARLGNSPEGSFLGPEIPGVHPPIGKYRDKDGCLKRQAVQFRLFRYEGEHCRELTAKDVESIVWTVHLRNTKAAAPRCSGVLKTRSTLRNPRVQDRRELILDGKVRELHGPNVAVEVNCERFMGRAFPKPLKLASLRTDAKGRLLVLGGHGLAGSLTGARLNEKNGNDFANHDGWYDDTSDGSVQAVVTLKDKSKIEAVPAWLIVAPPKYAPELQSITTLYDTLYQVALDRHLLPDPFAQAKRFRPSFRQDIYPILRRAMDLRWVFSRMGVAHEQQLSITQARRDAAYRNHVFRQFRVPSDSPKRPGTGTGLMPYIWSDLFPEVVNATVTRHQYNVLRAWSEGRFIEDWGRRQRRAKRVTPAGLDRASLEACVGAAFYPGIECSFYMRDKFRYMEPFRLDPDPANLRPGDVTSQMSIPWQSDFVDCNDGDEPFVWWPAQRPIDVVLPDKKKKKKNGQKKEYPTIRWARGFSGSKQDVSALGMVQDWHKLGLIDREGDRFVEKQRIEE